MVIFCFQGCYDKAMEYIKQHSLYITLACATVPVLLVSTPTPPPLPTFTPLTKHNILLNMVKVKGSRVIDWLIVCCLYVPLYNLSHLLRRQYWRCITRTFSWALTFLYRATRSSNGFLNFHTYTVRELLSVICICRVIFNLSQTFYVI